MQRYFVPNEHFEASQVIIEGEDARHIQKVMRMVPKDQIIVCNQNQEAFLCEITQSDLGGSVIAVIKEKLSMTSELPINVTIAQGLIKGDKLDWVVQKGTELGAYAFIPYAAPRSIVKWEGSAKVDRRRQRLEKIAKEAAEQSHRLHVPTIEEPQNLEALLKASENYDYCLVAYEEEAKQGSQSGLPTLLDQVPKGSSLLAVIGPEGGLEDSEVQVFKEKGFAICGLGQRILRAETAPLYLLAALSFYYELQKR